jgi:hypothetical protein
MFLQKNKILAARPQAANFAPGVCQENEKDIIL